MKGYWWAEYDPELYGEKYPWVPSLETEESMILSLPISFETKEICEDFIRETVLDRELRLE